MKRPLVACPVEYAWMSELCASSLNRQLGAFSMSTLLTKTSSDEVHSILHLVPREMYMHIINVSSLCTYIGQPCCPVLSQLQFSKSIFVAPDHTTEQWSRCDKTRTCGTCLVDSAVNAEQRFIMDRLLHILATVVSICFVHDSLQSRVTPNRLVSSTCSISTLFITRFS